jgi:hypothetical protein
MLSGCCCLLASCLVCVHCAPLLLPCASGLLHEIQLRTWEGEGGVGLRPFADLLG